ncbi:MAG: ATP synthase subunit delta [Chromatiales bacterium USCg_Taylor]|nr:MAG: ATP synthase subunit delta [Chromatiales bacterium USCg_Taylor]
MQATATLARPYAQAVFERARESGQWDEWSGALAFLGLLMQDPMMHKIAVDPRIERSKLERLIFDLAGDRLTPEIRNLIRVLLDGGRLQVLPEITRFFEELRTEAQGSVDVEVISAFDLSADQEQVIAAAIKRRVSKDLKVTTRIDRGLIGGAIVRVGDLVIDASLRGRLQQLSTRFN